MTTTEAAMQRAVADLDAVGARWALVGGLAVSARVAPRFTQDVDFAVAVAGDPEAEAIVFSLLSRNYHSAGHLEQDNVDRMSTARLVLTGSNVLIDLLFASSGIEPEIVAAATRIKVSPRMKVPVATLGHLIAMKALAGNAYLMAYVCTCGKPSIAFGDDMRGMFTGRCENGHDATVMAS